MDTRRRSVTLTASVGQPAATSNKSASRPKSKSVAVKIDEPVLDDEDSDSDDDFDAKKALIVQMESATLEETEKITNAAQESVRNCLALCRVLEKAQSLGANEVVRRGIDPKDPTTADDPIVAMNTYISDAVGKLLGEVKALTEVKHQGKVLKTCVARQQTAINRLKRPPPGAVDPKTGKKVLEGSKKLDPFDLWKQEISVTLDEQITQRLGIALRHRTYKLQAWSFRSWYEEYRKFKRAVMMWMKSWMNKAWRSWVWWVRKKHELGITTDIVVSRISNFLIVKAWNTWTDSMEYFKRRREELKVILLQMKSVRTAMALRGWRASVGRQQAARQQAVRTLSHMANWHLVRALRRWQEYVDERCDLRDKATVAASFFLRRLERSALEKWKAVMWEKKKAIYAMTKSITRTVKHAEFKAWNRWRAAVHELQEGRRRAAGAVTRMLKINMGRAFSTWRDAVEEKQHQEQLGNKCVRRLQNLKLWAAYARWQEMLEQIQEQRDKCNQVARRIRNINLAAGWDRWREMVEELHHQRRVVEKALLRMSRRILFAAMDGFRDAVLHRKEAMHKLRQAARFFSRRLEISALRRWAEQAEAQIQGRRTAFRAFKFMQNASLAKALNRWLHAMDFKAENEVKAKHVASKMLRFKALQAWNRWVEFVEELRVLHRKTGRAMAFWSGNTIAVSFYMWVDSLAEMRAAKAKLESVLRKMQNHARLRAFNRWVAAVEEAKDQRARLTKAIKRVQNAKAWAAFSTWRSETVFMSKQALKDQITNLKVSRCTVMRPLVKLTLRGITDAEFAKKTKYETIRRVGAKGRPTKEQMGKILEAIDKLEVASDVAGIVVDDVEALEDHALEALYHEMEALHVALATARLAMFHDRKQSRKQLAAEYGDYEWNSREKVKQQNYESTGNVAPTPAELPACSPLPLWLNWYWQTRHHYTTEKTTQPPELNIPPQTAPERIMSARHLAGGKKPNQQHMYSPRERPPPPGYWLQGPAEQQSSEAYIEHFPPAPTTPLRQGSFTDRPPSLATSITPSASVTPLIMPPSPQYRRDPTAGSNISPWIPANGWATPRTSSSTPGGGATRRRDIAESLQIRAMLAAAEGYRPGDDYRPSTAPEGESPRNRHNGKKGRPPPSPPKHARKLRSADTTLFEEEAFPSPRPPGDEAVVGWAERSATWGDPAAIHEGPEPPLPSALAREAHSYEDPNFGSDVDEGSAMFPLPAPPLGAALEGTHAQSVGSPRAQAVRRRL